MLGFELDFWDYATFLTLAILGIASLITIVFVLGLPGRIAIARKHPDAEAVNIMGWVGFLAIVPWIQAFIWAFKPTQPEGRSAGSARRMTEEFEACRTRCKWSAEHLPPPSFHDAFKSLHMLTVLLTLALCRCDASSCTVPSRFGCQPCGCRIRCPSAF
jgi:hypothetical protein